MNSNQSLMIFFFFFGASDLLPSVFTVVVFSSVFGVSNCLYCSFPDLLNLSFIISIVKPPYRRLYHAGYLPDSFSSAFMIAFAKFSSCTARLARNSLPIALPRLSLSERKYNGTS